MSWKTATTLPLVLGAALLVGCPSTPAEEAPAPPEEAGETAASEAHSPEEAGATSVREMNDVRDLDGDWLIGGRGRYRLHVSVADGRYRSRIVGDDTVREGELHIEPQGRGHYTLEVTADDAEDGHRVDVFFRSPYEAVGALQGETGLAFGRRIGEMPEELLGDWDVAFSDNYHLAGHTAHFEEDAWEVRRDGRASRSGPAFFLPSTDRLWHVAAMNNNGYPQLRYLQRTPDGAFLVWEDGNDQHMVISRPGERPDWIPEPDETTAFPFAERDLTRPGQPLGQ